ncbi:hypothetical protein FDK38_001526 [Candidozyma auris]|nr:hypothetical protein FDK38_001526 [[Candida] auris]
MDGQIPYSDHGTVASQGTAVGKIFNVFNRKPKDFSSADILKLMNKTNKKNKQMGKYQGRLIEALRLWGIKLTDVNNRNMIFHYAEVLESLNSMFRDEAPNATVHAQMVNVSSKEAKVGELFDKNDKLLKRKNWLISKYGLKCNQVQQVDDEIEDNLGRIEILREQVSKALNTHLQNALDEYNHWLTQKCIYVQMASTRMQGNKHGIRPDSEIFAMKAPSSLQTTPVFRGQQLDKASYGLKKLVMEKYESNQPVDNYGKTAAGAQGPDYGSGPHGPSKRDRVPTIFEKAASTILGPKKKEAGERSADASKKSSSEVGLSGTTKKDSSSSERPSRYTSTETSPEVGQYRLPWGRDDANVSKYANRPNMSAEDADKLSKAELQNEWANARNDVEDNFIEEKIRGYNGGGSRSNFFANHMPSWT